MTEDGRTVFQETAQAFANLHEMEAEIDRMNKELETRTDYESDSYMELIEQVSASSLANCSESSCFPKIEAISESVSLST